MAVCYPGGGGTNGNPRKPWSFVIMQKNLPSETTTDICDFTSLNKFSNEYFSSDLMGRTCMEATDIGPIKRYFPGYVERHKRDLNQDIRNNCLYLKPNSSRSFHSLVFPFIIYFVLFI